MAPLWDSFEEDPAGRHQSGAMSGGFDGDYAALCRDFLICHSRCASFRILLKSIK